MTTRKALIERIEAMQLGTQEMLDAAADDATLIPFDTLFADECGEVVWRIKSLYDDRDCVHMAGIKARRFYNASDLCAFSEQ